jgi:hypothetical protein
VVELLQGVSEYVEKNEPGTLKYQITVETKKSGESYIIMIESFVPLQLIFINCH